MIPVSRHGPCLTGVRRCVRPEAGGEGVAKNPDSRPMDACRTMMPERAGVLANHLTAHWIEKLYNKTMISFGAGRIAFTAFSVAVTAFAARRLLPFGTGSEQRRMLPSARARNFSTT